MFDSNSCYNYDIKLKYIPIIIIYNKSYNYVF